MANDCMFRMRVSGRSESGVRQLVDALKCKDFARGFFMVRVYDVDEIGGAEYTDGGLVSVTVDGVCAWSVVSSMLDAQYYEWRGLPVGEPRFSVFRDTGTGRLKFCNIPVLLTTLCRETACGVEVWSREPGNGFQEHILVSADGHPRGECRDWDPADGDGENAPETGGFAEWGTFMPPADVVDGVPALKAEETGDAGAGDAP